MTQLTVSRSHVTASEAARLLNRSRQRVNQMLVEGKLQGAFLMDCGDGREVWCIPRASVHEACVRQPKEKVRRNPLDKWMMRGAA